MRGVQSAELAGQPGSEYRGVFRFDLAAPWPPPAAGAVICFDRGLPEFNPGDDAPRADCWTITVITSEMGSSSADAPCHGVCRWINDDSPVCRAATHWIAIAVSSLRIGAGLVWTTIRWSPGSYSRHAGACGRSVLLRNFLLCDGCDDRTDALVAELCAFDRNHDPRSGHYVVDDPEGMGIEAQDYRPTRCFPWLRGIKGANKKIVRSIV